MDNTMQEKQASGRIKCQCQRVRRQMYNMSYPIMHVISDIWQVEMLSLLFVLQDTHWWMTLSIMLLQCACTWTIARVLYVLDLVAEEELYTVRFWSMPNVWCMYKWQNHLFLQYYKAWIWLRVIGCHGDVNRIKVLQVCEAVKCSGILGVKDEGEQPNTRTLILSRDPGWIPFSTSFPSYSIVARYLSTSSETHVPIMSTHHEEDDLAPTQTAGYKPGEKKSLQEYQTLDAQDESLNKWKESLGLKGAGKRKNTFNALSRVSCTCSSFSYWS